jgi:glycosyltransferase involved in cell wall biosynthesis
MDKRINLVEKRWVNRKDIVTISQDDRLIFDVNCNETDPHEYIQYEKLSSFAEVKNFSFTNLLNKTIKYTLDIDCEGEVTIQPVFITYSQNERVRTEHMDLKAIKLLRMTGDEENIKLAFRVSGKGTITVNSFYMEEYSDYNKLIDSEITKSIDEKFLVLTNNYPNYNDLYKNGFVRSRVISYLDNNIKLDVFALQKHGDMQKYEFDGVTVYKGNRETLRNVLTRVKYKKILIHFVNNSMYDTIMEVDPNYKLLVWVHGVESERWHRRLFNFRGPEDIKNLKEIMKDNFEKIKFMRQIYTRKDENIRFIFVSKFMKQMAEEDTGVDVVNYEIIHNVIDDDNFRYQEKTAEHRKKILTIRPFASYKYANDLTVKAILELSKRPFFKELEFTIYGDGALFNETLKPLLDRNFSNVKIIRKFLTQKEIAESHKDNGIFICPTRLDAQGVSMCEAMASGLVPVTNGITAIPEFVSSDQGMLVAGEDYLGLANAIEELYNSPEKFLRLSKGASEGIVRQSGIKAVVHAEIEVITK